MNCLIAYEDAPSEAVITRLVSAYAPKLAVTQRFPANGFGQIKANLQRFRNASNVLPHIVLTDLDQFACASALLQNWKVLPLHERMLFRIAVREVEAWLIADRRGIASLLSVAVSKVTTTPDDLPDPKQTLVNLARNSRSRRFASEFVPATGSVAQIGPLYNDHLCRFAREQWNVQNAVGFSPSLERSVARLRQFAAGLTT